MENPDSFNLTNSKAQFSLQIKIFSIGLNLTNKNVQQQRFSKSNIRFSSEKSLHICNIAIPVICICSNRPQSEPL